MANDEILLEHLPEQLMSVVQPVPALNRLLLQHTISRLLSPKTGLREQLVVRNFSYHFNFFVSKTASRKVIIFKRKKTSQEIVVDVDITFQLKPSLDRWSTPQIEKIPLLFKWDPPPFIVLDIQAAINSFPRTAGIQKEKAIGLRSQEGKLLIVHYEKQKDKKAEVWYDRGQKPLSGNKDWPAKPFFLIYRGIRDWLSGAWKEDRICPVVLGDTTDVAQIVRTIANAFCAGRKALVADNLQGESAENIWQLGRVDYALHDFRSNVLLRLDEAGEVALNKRDSAGHPFQLGLQLQLSEKPNYHEALIQMGIPDFLIEGDLYDAFWEIFLYRDGAKALRTELFASLKKAGYAGISPTDLFDLLEEGSETNGTVFRIDREGILDINLFIVSSVIRGIPQTIVFSGKFEVESVKPPKVRFKKGLKVLYQPEKDLIDSDVVDYFLRLAKYFKNWIDFLE